MKALITLKSIATKCGLMKPVLMKPVLGLISGLGIMLLSAVSASALPEKGGYTLQKAGTPLAEEIHIFHNWLIMPVMTGISLFVLALLTYTIIRYREKANPVPATFSHNTTIEIIWTFVPIVILLIIALPSFDLLYKEGKMPDGKQVIAQSNGSQTSFEFANDFNARRTVTKKGHLDVFVSSKKFENRLTYKKDYTVDGFGDEILTISLNEPVRAGEQVIIQGGRTRIGSGKFLDLFGEDRSEIALSPTVTLKAQGNQWNWKYTYPEFGDFEFTSFMLPKEETTEELYLYDTDNHVVLPVGESIRLITTASDVIHSWAMPAFAVKVDAVPGRNNETWFKVNEPGMYYGQCSEICGKDHSFMPISVKVVTRPEFETWVDGQRALAGLDPMFDGSAVRLVDAQNGRAKEDVLSVKSSLNIAAANQ